MVPLADLFNHGAQESIHIEMDGEGCPYCGSQGPCEHDYASTSDQGDWIDEEEGLDEEEIDTEEEEEDE